MKQVSLEMLVEDRYWQCRYKFVPHISWH